MDGLLFDTERICYRAYLRCARKFGIQMNDLVHLDLIGRVEADVVAETKRLFGQDKDVVGMRKVINSEKIRIREEQGGRVGTRPGAHALLSYLVERQIPYVIASSSKRSLIDSYLESEYLQHAFNRNIIDGSMVEHGKPDPEIFLRAAALIGVDPADTLVLEDSKAGILAAQAGGFMSGFVYDNMSDLGELADGDPILVELSGPEAIAELATASLETLTDAIGFIEGSRCPCTLQ